MGPGYLRNRLTPEGLAHPTCACRRGMLWIPPVKELQPAKSRIRAFSMPLTLWNIIPLEVRFVLTFLASVRA